MVELAGPRYQRKAADLPLRRWGSQLGSVYLALLLDGKSFAAEQIIIALGVTLDGRRSRWVSCRRRPKTSASAVASWAKVESYLPKSEQSRIRRKMEAAYGKPTYDGGVRRWTNSSQRHRWVATAVLDLEPRLRRIKGCRHLPMLRQALQDELGIKQLATTG